MGINKHEHFENHMDVATPDTIRDAEKIDIFSDDAYDDLFDERLSYLETLECKTPNKIYTISDGNSKDFEKESKKQGSSISVTEKIHDTAHLLDSAPSDEKLEHKKDIVFSGSANENTQFGEGGGRQYFIRDFGVMVKDGRMEKVSEKRLTYDKPLEERDIIISNTTQIKKYDSESLKHIEVNADPLTAEEKAEWKELDENTPDEQGLSRAMPDKESQEIEDYLQPITDQESSQGIFMPDGFSNPRNIDSGEVFYQLRPANAKRDSPYVTDEKTVIECSSGDGVTDVGKLLQKLQIYPGTNFDYILSKYIYTPVDGLNNQK